MVQLFPNFSELWKYNQKRHKGPLDHVRGRFYRNIECRDLRRITVRSEDLRAVFANLDIF